jgi:hypothetical protein
MRGIKEKCTQGFGAGIQSKELEDLDIDVRINTSYILNKGWEVGGYHGPNSSGSEHVQMPGWCEHGNETSQSIKLEKFLDQRGNN